jgi:phospholipid/cholesterol/gamma-HCH transport system permease protein
MATSLWYLYKYRKYGKKIIRNTLYKQILFTGYDGLSVIGFIAFLIGAIVLVIGSGITQKVGVSGIYAALVRYVLLRELAPLLTAIILIARSGTAISTEIGNMKVNNEIDVLCSLGINIRHFIIGPRIVGFTISLLGLTYFFFFIGIAGGYIVTYLLIGLRFSSFINAIFTSVSVYDINVVAIKCLAMGLIISTISCYNGFLVKRSTTEVPIFSTRSVVISLKLCFLTYAYITALSYI